MDEEREEDGDALDEDGSDIVWMYLNKLFGPYVKQTHLDHFEYLCKVFRLR